MIKERLTLEETFNKYNGKEFYMRLDENQQNIKVNFTVVGYMEKTSFLIGELIKHQGIAGHFKIPHGCDIIENFKEGKTYVYINANRFEKYPLKKIVKKKIIEEVAKINIDILEF